MKVKQLGSNQTQVEVNDKTILVSYSTPVAAHVCGEGFFKTAKKWSTTTSRHISKWLDGAKAEEKPQEFFDNLI